MVVTLSLSVHRSPLDTDVARLNDHAFIIRQFEQA